jgi:hypothetical protein
MPFTKQVDREKMLRWMQTGELRPGEEIVVGDKCFVKYREMMQEWNKSRRWTTAHNIYKRMKQRLLCIENGDEDEALAYDLAWQVFFVKEVLKYEDEKEAENGPITGE